MHGHGRGSFTDVRHEHWPRVILGYVILWDYLHALVGKGVCTDISNASLDQGREYLHA